jgi:hypothetical protein
VIGAERRVRSPVQLESGEIEYGRVGTVKAGTLVEIPDQWVNEWNKKNPGRRDDLDGILNHWLRNAGVTTQPSKETPSQRKKITGDQVPALGRFDGMRLEYFYPVQLAGSDSADGSTVNPEFKGKTFHIALSDLARSGQARFATQRDLELLQKKKSNPTSKHAENITSAETATAAQMRAAEVCDACIEPIDAIFALQKNLADELLAVDRQTSEKTKQFDINRLNLAEQFKKHCGGRDLEKFQQLMKVEVNRQMSGVRGLDTNVAYELLMSIMINESAGSVGNLCRALNSGDPRGGSWGLFQINAASASNEACRKLGASEVPLNKQVSASKGNAEFEKNYSQCQAYISNPENNLKEAVRILRDKSRELFAGSKPIFDVSRVSNVDQMRLLASAYNGGSHYIKAAQLATEKFNRVQAQKLNIKPSEIPQLVREGVLLDSHKWEDLRLAYLRIFVSSKDDPVFYGAKSYVRDPQTGQRKLAHEDQQRSRWRTLVNMAYAENLVPRAGVHAGQLRRADGSFMSLVARSPSAQ